jgi:hypothetical protein
MTNTLTKIISAGILAGAMLLPGCATLDSASNKTPTSTPSISAKDEVKNERKPITVSGYAWERVTSDTVLASGKVVGKGPSGETYLEARVGTDDFNIAGSTWSVFSGMTGRNTEQDYTFETRLKLNENVTIGVDPAFWTFPAGDVLVTKFPLLYKNGNFTACFKPIVDMRNGGVLYVGFASRTFPIEGSELSFTPKVLTAYADKFVGADGYMHVTPGLGAHLGHIGPVEVNGDINYQISTSPIRNDVLYGGLNFEVKTGKKELRGEKK